MINLVIKAGDQKILAVFWPNVTILVFSRYQFHEPLAEHLKFFDFCKKAAIAKKWQKITKYQKYLLLKIFYYKP